MLPSTPAATIPNRVRSPFETLKPANSMIASLGIGMQALSSVISTKTPARPAQSMKSVAALTIGVDDSGGEQGHWQAGRRGRQAESGRSRNTAAPVASSAVDLARGPSQPPRLPQSLTLQAFADALLVAAAFYLAFKLRFLDSTRGIGPQGIPTRYVDLLVTSIGFVVVGKLVVFAVFGLYQKWWRYFALGDYVAIVRAAAISTAILVVAFTVVKPFSHGIPRSVAVLDFILTLMLVAGARLVVRMVLERPARGALRDGARDVLVVGAGSGGQMVVRELQLNLRTWAPARSASSTTTRASAACGCSASRCSVRPTRSAASSTRPSPTRS